MILLAGGVRVLRVYGSEDVVRACGSEVGLFCCREVEVG